MCVVRPAVLLTATVLVACGSEHRTGPEPVTPIAELAGHGTVTLWEYRRATGAPEPTDWVVTQRVTGMLVIQPKGHDYGHLTLQGDALPLGCPLPVSHAGQRRGAGRWSPEE